MSEAVQIGSLGLEEDKMDVDVIEMENDIDETGVDKSSEKKGKRGLVECGLEAYTYNSLLIKDKVDNLGAEIAQRQDKIKLLHQILQAINKLSNEKGLDISQQTELQEKLKVAKELGVDISIDRMNYNAQERDFLKESLCMAADDFNNENKLQQQKMNVLSQEADRWLTLANTMLKVTERACKHTVEKL